MAIDFKQYNYPDVPFAGETIAAAGCGACACADILEIDPVITAEWLDANGWTVSGQGTIYEGIAACLTAFGGSGKMLVRDQDGITESSGFESWRRMIAEGQEGVLLMHNVVSDYWTRGGHYIAVVGYDHDSFLVYDPASVARTGWHPFSDFAGNISALYTSDIRWKEESKYMFEVNQIKRGDQGNDVYLMQSILRGRGYIDRKTRKLPEVDGSFGESSERCLIYFQSKNDLEQDGICGNQTWTKLLKR